MLRMINFFQRRGKMRNSDRFLIAFNKIEKALKEYTQIDKHLPFARLINIVKKTNPIIRRYHDDLKEFSDLRNAIVHDTTNTEYAIAEPHDDIVVLIEKIADDLVNPKKVIPTFAKKVTVFQAHNSLCDLLNSIKELAYTKYPIYDHNKFLGLLSKEGIVNWLAQNVEKQCNFNEVKLQDILAYQKEKNYLFIPTKMTIHEAKEIFTRQTEKASGRLDALLITGNGQDNENLLGIITLADIVNIE